MKVLKFGGSSVGTPERILSIVEILRNYRAEGEPFTVVFSAFGGTTDRLIEMATLAAEGNTSYESVFKAFSDRHLDVVNYLISAEGRDDVLSVIKNNHEVLKNLLSGIFLVREASPRTMDYVLSFGERNAAFIISKVLNERGIPAQYLDAREIIKTNKDFGKAKVDLSTTYQKIANHYSKVADIQIVTGFIASAKGGLTTTLGRGGSDYTASLIAAALSASVLEIWTDVDGVLTGDPRKVKRAFSIEDMSYMEALEMSHFGAKVIYPPTIQPVMRAGILLIIKNTLNPSHPGTKISKEANATSGAVKGISSISNIALLTIQGSGLFGVPGIAGTVFSSLANSGINVILITQGSSEYSISFAIEPQYAMMAKEILEQVFRSEIRNGLIEPVKVEHELSTVAIIGEQMRYRPGIAARLFNALGKNGINVVAIAQGSSELNISVVLQKRDEIKALNVLHNGFFLSQTTQIHLFIVGVGLIGNALIEQIRKQFKFLSDNRSIEVRVIGIANSKRLLFDEGGIDLEDWKIKLMEQGEFGGIDLFISTMRSFNLPNTIFVDNTASDDVAFRYAEILDSSISISTPNKVACSSELEYYLTLRRIAKKREVGLSYETNVGAGLPVISTLRNLIDSGDEILKIEGVVSGSLSFIFSGLSETSSFSEMVNKAARLGYTEPDPRIDLGGTDVKRKLLILAREAGYMMHMEDINYVTVLPEFISMTGSTEAFFESLPSADPYFQGLVKEANKAQKKLRLIARLENGIGCIRLEQVDVTSPFYHLNGGDNMIVFTTDRYRDRPLVVTGPGAGAEVTAAGVFAEILSIGNALK
jgi:bifunctional aspartokinase / homoserine dehydrogenase 1